MAAGPVAGDGAARAEATGYAQESLDYVIAQTARADWGTAALRRCGGKQGEAAERELPALQERVALTLLMSDWAPARPVLEDYVSCALAAERFDALA
ncbi:MAG: hypothetical protein FJX53_04895 [Alphaproteobacteria bacterium]|nr:hypothetical protein [Alphaproteobacteria bacterium]